MMHKMCPQCMTGSGCVHPGVPQLGSLLPCIVGTRLHRSGRVHDAGQPPELVHGISTNGQGECHKHAIRAPVVRWLQAEAWRFVWRLAPFQPCLGVTRAYIWPRLSARCLHIDNE